MNSQSREKCAQFFSIGLGARQLQKLDSVGNREMYHLNAIHELLKLINLGQLILAEPKGEEDGYQGGGGHLLDLFNRLAVAMV